MKAMKEKHACFETTVSDRKGSKIGCELAPFSRDEVRIQGQAARSSLKKTTGWWYGGSHVWAQKLRVLTSITHLSTRKFILADLSDDPGLAYLNSNEAGGYPPAWE